MPKLQWGAVGQRRFEAGVDRGVLYAPSYAGVPWNGLVNVVETPVGGTPEPIYVDGVKINDVVSNEFYSATIEAYSAPPEFKVCEGEKQIYPGVFAGQQVRQRFSFTYRTLIGNDTAGIKHGYKLHLVYNATATSTEKTNATMTNSVNPTMRKWTINAIPPQVSYDDIDFGPNARFTPSAHYVIDSTLVASSSRLEEVEEILYGSNSAAMIARMPVIEEVLTILEYGA